MKNSIEDIENKIHSCHIIRPKNDKEYKNFPKCEYCGAVINKQYSCMFCGEKHNYVFLSHEEYQELIKFFEYSSASSLMNVFNFGLSEIRSILGREIIRY